MASVSVNNIQKWNYLSEYFKETTISADSKNILFKCLLCIPKEKIISTSTSSNSNLRSHIKVSKYNIYNLLL